MKGKKVKKTVATVLAGIGVFLVAAFAALLLVSGIFTSPQYLEPWQKDYAQKFDDPRLRLAAHGLLAANGHNMQPWKIRLDDGDPAAFYLYADSARQTGEVDPPARQMMITQGAFLEYVKIAGEKLGYQTAIELFPEGGYDEQKLTESMDAKPVAKITLTQGKPQSAPLYDAMFLPDTNRLAYRPDKLTAEQTDGLENVQGGAGISVRIFQDGENMEKLSGLAMEAAAVEAGVARVMKESEVIFRANEAQKNEYRYGFSVEGQGTSGIMGHLMQGLVTIFPSMNSGKAAADVFLQSTKTSVENTPAYLLIVTDGNSRESQVRSGMLYSELILKAHRLGLAMQPLSQALEEYPEMKEPYGEIHRQYAPGGGTVQMLVRVGQPTKEVPLSMRRDVMDLVTKAEKMDYILKNGQ